MPSAPKNRLSLFFLTALGLQAAASPAAPQNRPRDDSATVYTYTGVISYTVPPSMPSDGCVGGVSTISDAAATPTCAPGCQTFANKVAGGAAVTTVGFICGPPQGEEVYTTGLVTSTCAPGSTVKAFPDAIPTAQTRCVAA